MRCYAKVSLSWEILPKTFARQPELQLDRKLSNRRVYPAIDITASGTRREDLLMDKEEIEKICGNTYWVQYKIKIMESLINFWD
mgnify:CR=1 FL=1